MRAALLALPLLLAACSQGDSEAQKAAADLPEGAPCPTLTAEAFEARGVTLGSTAGLNGANFSRQGGSSSCKVDDGGDIACDMLAPGVVRVTGAADTTAFYFDIPEGRNARVSMSHDIARCVLN